MKELISGFKLHVNWRNIGRREIKLELCGKFQCRPSKEKLIRKYF
jgi:hypothetical protein